MQLKPQEYYYLYSTMRSDPLLILKYTYLGLFAEGHLKFYTKMQLPRKNTTKKWPILFIKHGAFYNPENSYTRAELLALSVIDEGETRFADVNKRMFNRINNDPEIFKNNYVYEDLNKKGYCVMKHLITENGAQAKNRCAFLIDAVDENIDKLLLDVAKLTRYLNELGSNIIFLERKTLQILKSEIYILPELAFSIRVLLEDEKIDFFCYDTNFFNFTPIEFTKEDDSIFG